MSNVIELRPDHVKQSLLRFTDELRARIESGETIGLGCILINKNGTTLDYRNYLSEYNTLLVGATAKLQATLLDDDALASFVGDDDA